MHEQAAHALVNVAVVLRMLDRPEEAIAACRQVLDRYGEDPAPALRELSAKQSGVRPKHLPTDQQTKLPEVFSARRG